MIAARLLCRLLLLAGLALLLSAPAGAAGPVLDPGFGTGGRAIGSAPANAAFTGFAAVRSPDGRIYVAQGPGLSAFLPDGIPDRSFGAGGSVVFPEVRWPVYFTVADLAVDGQGRVLVAGTWITNDPDPEEPSQVAAVIRYLPDGRLDPWFAEGGVLRTTFGLPGPRDESGLSPASADHVAVRLAGLGIDGGGRILLAGSYAERTVKCPDGGSYEMPLAFLARFGPDGQPDGSFGQGGLALQPGLGLPTDLQVDAAGASTFTATPPRCGLPREGALARVDATGSPDVSFGSGGRRGLAEPPARLTTDPNGRLLVLSSPRRFNGPGRVHSVTVIRRFNGKGALDRSFARHGAAGIRLPGRSSLFGSIAVDPRGRVLLAGALNLRRTKPQTDSIRRFVLARLRSDGLRDLSFGSRGTLTTPFGRRSRANARAILLEPNGGIVLAGSLGASYLVNETGFALARYRP
ncbi:MAG TPA: hypothetical protein VJU14_08600 [Solirubrobacterales bacterium]|nr:hypothetical protein [Solirubrobacterales bacterium]